MEGAPAAPTSFFAQRNRPQSEREVEEAEYILAQEEYELQALVAAMEDGDVHDQASQHYGSDEDDYDQIFMECTSRENTQRTSTSAGSGSPDPDAMDMTEG